MRFFVSVLTAVICVFIEPAASAEPAQGKLTVYFVGCAARASLNVFDIGRQRDFPTAIEMKLGPVKGVQTASIMLRDGYYEVGAGRLPCAATRRIVILDGIDRNVVLKGGDVLHLTEGLSGMGGSLPSDDLSVAATCESRSGKVEYMAQVSRHAYYFDNIEAPASCVLRMRSMGRFASDLTTSAVIPITSGKCVIYNFSWPTISE